MTAHHETQAQPDGVYMRSANFRPIQHVVAGLAACFSISELLGMCRF